MPRTYWDIKYWDTGSGLWINDNKIPRAGLEPFTRTDQANISFIELADGNLAKISDEKKANWQEIILTFPKQVVNETVKNQLIDYIDEEKGIQIVVPILTGSSSYTEKIIEGYPMLYEETWELDNRSNIRNIIRLTIKEFNVDGS